MVCRAVATLLLASAICVGAGNAIADPGKKDDDQDGVVNRLDQCPNTPSTSAIDANGCPTLVSSIKHYEQVLFFAKNSPRPLDNEYTKIDNIAIYVRKNPSDFVLVEGFMSVAESLDGVDAQRTKRVIQMLIDAGVKRDHIRVANAGEHTPMVEGDTPAAHAANQRVFIRVVQTLTAHEQRFMPLL